MLHDRAQKANVLKLCISKRWLPQIEIDVEPKGRTAKEKYLLTDMDVMAYVPQTISGFERIIFDCKSGRKESAISRAFWLRGLMDKVGANQGFVILNNKVSISRDHRINASELSVSLLHENDFEVLSSSLGGSLNYIGAASAEIENWEKFFALNAKYPQLQDYLQFSKSSYWMIRDPGEQCRKTVAKLRALKAELDPDKPEHLSIFADAICLFVLSLSQLTLKIFLSFLHPSSQSELSDALLAVIYGGYENLEAAKKLRRISLQLGDDEHVSVFPELEKLEQLARELLQSPPQALSSAMLAREVGMGFLSEAQGNSFAQTLSAEQPYAVKFCLLSAEYLCKACKLPPDFGIHFSNLFLNLYQPNSQNK